MNISIIGTGNVGRALGMGWAQAGHQVVWASRDPKSETVQALLAEAGGAASATSVADAVAGCDVAILAVPWPVAQQVVEGVVDWQGKILIDATNPIAPGLQLAVGFEQSGGELVAAWAKNARVVKAFNTTGAGNMADPIYDGQPITMFIAGDDADARQVVARLAAELGFDVADVGGIEAARYLEPLAMVWIRLAFAQGIGPNVAFKLVMR